MEFCWQSDYGGRSVEIDDNTSKNVLLLQKWILNSHAEKHNLNILHPEV